MITGIYFSGTGNSRYAAELFVSQIEPGAGVHSIEDDDVIDAIRSADTLVFSYPVMYSTVPKILRDFVVDHAELWKGKKVFVIATMGLFSGDGSGILARLLKRYGAVVVGGLHLKMPDSICDEKALKRPLQKNIEMIREARAKIAASAESWRAGKPTREGIGPQYRIAGFFGQRLYFGHKTKHYSDKLKIDAGKCVGCGLCAKLCPMDNIVVTGGVAVPADRCTMCYRCINRCPAQAITLLGKAVVEQGVIEKYIKDDEGRENVGKTSVAPEEKPHAGDAREVWDLYDRDGNVTGETFVRGSEPPENIREGLYHLVVDILVMHEDGTYLLTRRSMCKETYAGFWEASAGGSALTGETPDEAAGRELFEETGLTADSMELVATSFKDENRAMYYSYLARVHCDKESIVLQEGETDEYKWVDVAALLEHVESEDSMKAHNQRYAEYFKSLR